MLLKTLNLFCILLISSSCLEKEKSKREAVLPSGDVSIKNESFAINTQMQEEPGTGGETPPPETTSKEFKLCVAEVEFENEAGDAVEKDGSVDIEFKPGLIDLSSGASTSWGFLEDIPVGYKVKKMKMEMESDPQLCQGADYSVIYDGISTDKSVEFKFKFEPPILLEDGDNLKLQFQTIFNTLQQAAQDGTLNEEELKNRIEELEESADDDDDDDDDDVN